MTKFAYPSVDASIPPSEFVALWNQRGPRLVQAVNEKQRAIVVDPRDWGNVGGGNNDDTAAMQAAVDSLKGTSGVVVAPPGHYMISSLSMATSEYDGITVRGSGMRASHFDFTTTGTAIALGSQAGPVVSEIVFENLWISAPNTNIMVNMLNAGQCTFSRLYVDKSGNTGANSKGFRLYGCMSTLFSEVSYGGNVNAKYGIYIGDDSDGTTINHCYVKGEPTASIYSIVCDAGPTVAAHVCTVIADSVIGGGSLASILVGLTADTPLVQIRNNYFESPVVGVELGNAAAPYYAKNVRIEGNYFYHASSDAIRLNASRNVRVEDNNFVSTGGFDIALNATSSKNTGFISTLNTPSSAGSHLSIPANHPASYYQDGNGALHDHLNYLLNSDFWNPGSIAVGASLTKTTTVTGAALGDRAEVSISIDLAGLTLTAYVSAINTVTTVLSNTTAGAVDLAIFDMYVKVSKPN